MPRDYTQEPYTSVRRRDRAIDDEAWIVEMLQRAAVGTLATVHDGQPFINSNLFVYDADAHVIYLHTARVGRTAGNVAAETKVCFSVSEMGRLLPAAEALEFSVEYSGVVAFGRATLVEGEEAQSGLQLLLDKYCPHLKPGTHYRPIMPDELKRTAVYRVEIDEWSGKRKAVDDTFAESIGAYIYGDPPENPPILYQPNDTGSDT